MLWQRKSHQNHEILIIRYWDNTKLILGGFCLIASLFLSTYYSDVEEVIMIHHPFDNEPYSLKSYWYQFSLHLDSLVYVFVFGVIKSGFGFLKWLFFIITALRVIDFYLAYSDYLIDLDAVNIVMIPTVIIYVVKKTLIKEV